MGNFGFPEMLVVGVLALMVFGPERLPELARTAGKFIARFRAEATRSIADLKAAADLGDLDGDFRAIRNELTATREEISRGLREPVDAVKGVSGELKAVAEGGPTGSVPTHVGPAPMDPEAT